MRPVCQREVLNTSDVGDSSPGTQAQQKLYGCRDPSSIQTYSSNNLNEGLEDALTLCMGPKFAPKLKGRFLRVLKLNCK